MIQNRANELILVKQWAKPAAYFLNRMYPGRPSYPGHLRRRKTVFEEEAFVPINETNKLQMSRLRAIIRKHVALWSYVPSDRIAGALGSYWRLGVNDLDCVHTGYRSIHPAYPVYMA